MKTRSLLWTAASLVLILSGPVHAVTGLHSHVLDANYARSVDTWKSNWSLDRQSYSADGGTVTPIVGERVESYLDVGTLRGGGVSVSINGYPVSTIRTESDFGGMHLRDPGRYHIGQDVAVTSVKSTGGEFNFFARINGPSASSGQEWNMGQHHHAGTRKGDLPPQIRQLKPEHGATPEPGTLALLGLGLIALIPVLRSQRRQAYVP